MENREGSEHHPMWEGAIVGFLAAVESGMLHPDQIIPMTGQVCIELMQSGMLDNMGELQAYLRQRGSLVQIIACPFNSDELPPELPAGVRCVDIITKEPRGHWMTVCVGEGEAGRQLTRLTMSDEVNEATLRNDTGMLTL